MASTEMAARADFPKKRQNSFEVLYMTSASGYAVPLTKFKAADVVLR